MLTDLFMWDILSGLHGAGETFMKPWVGKGGHGLLSGAMLLRAARWGLRTAIDTPISLLSGGMKPFHALEEAVSEGLAATSFFGESAITSMEKAKLVHKVGESYKLTAEGEKALLKAGVKPSQIFEMKNGAIAGAQRGLFGKALFNEQLRPFAGNMLRMGIGRTAGVAFGMLNLALLAEVVTLPMTLAEAFEGWSPTSRRYSNSFNNPRWGMHEAAATQRQAALSALHNSQMNVRAVLGNEAGFMHR